MQRMSDSEKKIMEYIWAAGHPVTTSEIIKNLPEAAEWKQNTVITFLTRLIRKKILKATRIGKANQYEPCITEQEYRNFEIKQFIKDVHKGSVLGFISSLCDNGDITLEDIESLMKRFKK
ncbi:BlaI/MecI/CopY family transcriptional regulator [Thermoanaerobacterium sp. RBIITD]|uniref:BlaI/MecI/CopY family transcriptional regulator n=1 Tax=Thermoanaerobacterium sp. RBIITD TaxID=1550240 RepID=UPI000BB8BAED|nr:BlaI/MecI/CopY family transcriptional regulator [Thermoanaerobacterium sp. RBIITD]SNX53161.1 Predicted transcriptional regulator [Thermoanaerobacterium sp. RBIITD]